MGDATAALHGPATELVGVDDSDEAMQRIVAGALTVVPAAHWGGMCVQRRAHGPAEGAPLIVHAASDPLVERLGNLQASDGDGPCLEATHGASTVHVADLHTESRWPRFRRAAERHGVRSLLAVGLPVTRPGGALHLYSPQADAFDADTRALVEVFADHAAIALAGARRAGGLHRAVASRDLLGQAKGILMHQHGVNADRAFELLVEASQHANLKLVAVAQWVVDGVTATPPADGRMSSTS